MIANETEIFTSALALPRDRRAVLARVLLHSLPAEDPQILTDSWRVEIAQRLDDFEAGRTKAIPAEEVFEELRRDD